jgi:micrococcal nuclease
MIIESGVPYGILRVRAAYPHGFYPVLPDCKDRPGLTTGERIYHLPSQGYYDETVITFDKSERWFCSESEARQADWRKSKV